MRYLAIILFVLIGCKCPEVKKCPDIPECIPDTIYQIDTLYYDITCYPCIDSLLAFVDSIKKVHIHDNLIIKGDTLHNVEARFDSITGKPYLRYGAK